MRGKRDGKVNSRIASEGHGKRACSDLSGEDGTSMMDAGIGFARH